MWLLVYLLVGFAAGLFMFVVPALLLGHLLLGALGVVGGVGVSALTYYIWRKWALRREEALTRESADWTGRFEAIRTRMEAYLEDL